MKIIQVNADNMVIDILNAKDDVTQESIFVVNDIPEFEYKEGFNGVLMYTPEKGIYWEYEAPKEEVISDEDEITDEELGAMLKEVI